MPALHSRQSIQHAIRFERLSLESGLSDHTVLAIHQDTQGFMWFGTRAGLNRYDGHEFTVYRPDPEDQDALTNAFVTAIQEGEDGSLWIGTFAGGLNRFDRESATFASYRHDPDDVNSLSEDDIWRLYRDSAGVLWIGTISGGLNAFDRTTQTFVRYQHVADDPTSLSNDFVRSIIEDESGALWVGTNNGLNRLDRATGLFTRYRHNAEDTGSLSDDLVTSLYQDRDGVLWIGTGRGLSRYDPGTDRFKSYVHDPQNPGSPAAGAVTAIGEDATGTLWIGTARAFGGLDRFDRATETFIHFANKDNDLRSLSSNDVRCIYLDRGGVLWIGTYGGGVNKLNPATEAFLHYQRDPGQESTLSHNYVTSFYADGEDVLWIGTRGGGLNRLDRAAGTFTAYRHDPGDTGSLSDDNVWSIYRDQQGTLWVGTEMGGLNRFEPASQTFAHYRHNPGDTSSLGDDFVRTIYQDREGTLWLGTYNGLDRFDPMSDTFEHYRPGPDTPNSLSSDVILSIYEDQRGDLWIATERGGLNRFDRSTGSSTVYAHDPDDPTSLIDNSPIALGEDHAGNLWVCTSAGLDRFDPGTETFRHYGEQQGLADTSIHGLVVDHDGYLWLSTNRGLERLDPRSETFKNYDASHGLPSGGYNNGAYHRADSGELYFGGALGFSAFRPERIWENPHAPPVVVTAFSLFGERMRTDLADGEGIELSHRDNFISFDYAALDYAAPDKNQYAYMMQGVDKDWVYAGTRRHADYPNLRWGNYVFRVKGSNNDGVWNEQGIEIAIAITPPIWATWWFRGLVALVVVSGAAGGYWLQVKSVEARAHRLERQVQQRTHELAALYRADQELYRSLDLEQVLQALVDVAVEYLEVDKSSLMTWDENHDRMVVRAARGFSADTMARMSFAPGEGDVGQVVLSGEPVIVEDTGADSAQLRSDITEPEGIRAFIHVPIKVGEDVFGVFNASFSEPRTLDGHERQLFVGLAQRAVPAIQNAQLYEQAQELAAVRERQRLARDLHDAVTQTLFSASLIAESVPELWAQNPQRGQEMLDKVRQLSRGALAEMRTLLIELRPTRLLEANLEALLRQLAQAASGREGIPVHVTVKRVCDLPAEVHIAIYRIAQEALNNVVKHALAKEAAISLHCGDDPVLCAQLRIRDDGCGFDTSGISAEHLGLGIMRERARAIGAVLQVESKIGQGSEVMLQWTAGESGENDE